MTPVIFLLFFSITFFVIGSAQAATGINRTINFQGRVVNKSDSTNITNGNYTFIFSIYSAASGGSQLWGPETQTNVSVTNGIFQVALGSVTSFGSLDFNQDNLWLDITFNGEQFSSRIRLAAVPYAFTAEKVAGLTVTNNGGNTLTIAANKIFTVNNSITFSGTDSTSFSLPTTSDTLAGLATSQTFTTTQTVTPSTNVSAFVLNGTNITTNNAESISASAFAPVSGNTVSGIALTFTNASSNSSGTSTVAGLTITPTQNSSNNGTHNTIGLNFATLTNTACGTSGICNKYGIYFPSSNNYTDILNYNGTSVINATGQVNAGQLTGAINIGSSTITSGAINGLTFTANTQGFSVAGGVTSKTLTVNNSLGFSGTDATTMTFPASSTTVAGLSIAETFTNAQTIAPTQASAVGLTVNTTTNATPADGIDVVTAHTSGIATNGILFNQNAAGTTTNGVQIQQSSGTLTNGLVFTGTITNDITTGTSGRALTIGTNGAGAITINPGGSAGLNLGTSNANGVTIGTSSNTTTAQGSFVVGTSGNTFTFNPASGPIYAGTARPTKTIVLSAEYAGAVLTASGSANISGNMTSDASPSATPTSYDWQNYYQWNATTDMSPTLQDYTVAVRVTLPKDFAAWATGNCFTIAYNTGFASSSLNSFDVYIYQNADASGSPVALSTGNASAKSWTTVNFTNSSFGGAKAWNTAGAQAVIYLKLRSTNTPNYVQVGDITMNYVAAF